MNVLRKHIFSNPGLTRDQYRNLHLAGPLGKFQHPLELRVLSLDKIEVVFLRLAEMGQFTPHAHRFKGALDGSLQLVQLERFGKEVMRAIFHGIDRHFDVTVGSDNDDRRARWHVGGLIKQAGPVTIR